MIDLGLTFPMQMLVISVDFVGANILVWIAVQSACGRITSTRVIATDNCV